MYLDKCPRTVGTRISLETNTIERKRHREIFENS